MKAITDAVLSAFGAETPTMATAEETVAMLNLEKPSAWNKFARKKDNRQWEIMPFHDDPVLFAV
jgi:hypothetical protein